MDREGKVGGLAPCLPGLLRQMGLPRERRKERLDPGGRTENPETDPRHMVKEL